MSRADNLQYETICTHLRVARLHAHHDTCVGQIKADHVAQQVCTWSTLRAVCIEWKNSGRARESSSEDMGWLEIRLQVDSLFLYR
jgi:hypothetical protein